MLCVFKKEIQDYSGQISCQNEGENSSSLDVWKTTDDEKVENFTTASIGESKMDDENVDDQILHLVIILTTHYINHRVRSKVSVILFFEFKDKCLRYFKNFFTGKLHIKTQ